MAKAKRLKLPGVLPLKSMVEREKRIVAETLARILRAECGTRAGHPIGYRTDYCPSCQDHERVARASGATS